ncbi:MAG TPA: GntR family transcriptional regulator [Anaerolineales bacterium]|nr:GntR family transcriptional regulator [Anaerolineales bacterium]
MEISLNFRSGIPIYIQIMEQIKRQIAGGALHPGDQLPTVRQMATDLRVNFNTIARAYRLLDEAGIISTQHGRGTYILEETSAETSTQLRQQALEELTLRYLETAVRLGFPPQEVASLFEVSLEKWKARGSSSGDEAEDYE